MQPWSNLDNQPPGRSGPLIGGQRTRLDSQPQASTASRPEPPAGTSLSASAPGSQELPFPQLSLSLFIRATGGNLKLRFLAALLFLAIIPAFAVALLYQQAGGQVNNGLLAPRNAPLILLSIVVVTVLVATWVALPIVRPIRRATREILATTDEVRVLAARAEQLTEDQRQGAAILDAAANGLYLRRTSIKRDAGLADRQMTRAAEALISLGHLITDTPDPRRRQFQQLAIEIHRLLEEAHGYTAGIVAGLSDESSQTQLSEVRAGTREIIDQFAEASQRLNKGAEQLERAALTLL